ncbi:pyridoxal-phosphate dependent enzyme [Pseudonocardia nematodicida]|uniref:pyridoxal-phosphate dependent enzyme n=1 Tax=Pseudonocardia nematodicida TaxID=1206997 RepID=UPI00360C5FAD
MIFSRVDLIVHDEVFLEVNNIIPHARLLVKLEGLNPAGSIKLKTAVGLVDDAERSGLLRPGGTLIESSSGNLGVALAIVAASRSYQFICVTDSKSTSAHIRQMQAHGAEVIKAEQAWTGQPLLDARLRLVESVCHARPDIVWLNQYASSANSTAHYETTAEAVLRNVEAVDYLFIGLGTAGTFAGCARRFREESPSTYLVAVDSVGSVTLGGPEAVRHLPGIGAGVPPKLFDPTAPDDAVVVPESDAIEMCSNLARRTGLLTGASTGTVLAACERMAAVIPPGSTVVAISPDGGERYLDLHYSSTWLRSHYPQQDRLHRAIDEVSL